MNNKKQHERERGGERERDLDYCRTNNIREMVGDNPNSNDTSSVCFFFVDKDTSSMLKVIFYVLFLFYIHLTKEKV